jgi:hypothetical protein
MIPQPWKQMMRRKQRKALGRYEKHLWLQDLEWPQWLTHPDV